MANGLLRTLLDTSVVVPALLETHPSHTAASDWLHRAEIGEIDGIVSSHTLSEVYKVITGMNRRPRYTASQVMRIISDRVLPFFDIITLEAHEHIAAMEQLVRLDITGGTIYDGLIAHAAVKGNAEQLVTFNESDFRRVSAGLPLQIIVP